MTPRLRLPLLASAAWALAAGPALAAITFTFNAPYDSDVFGVTPFQSGDAMSAVLVLDETALGTVEEFESDPGIFTVGFSPAAVLGWEVSIERDGTQIYSTAFTDLDTSFYLELEVSTVPGMYFHSMSATIIGAHPLSLGGEEFSLDEITFAWGANGPAPLGFGEDEIFAIEFVDGETHTLEDFLGTSIDSAQQVGVIVSSDTFAAASFVSATIPEPSAALLSGLGFLALLRRRR